jgi:hypothetical protein
MAADSVSGRTTVQTHHFDLWVVGLLLLLAVVWTRPGFSQEEQTETESPPHAEEPESHPADVHGMPPSAVPEDRYAPLKAIRLGSGTLGVEFSARSRFEIYKGYDVRQYNNVDEDDLLLLRIRLGLGYRFGEGGRFQLELQDSRYWLSDLERDAFSRSSPFYDNLDVRQAYFEFSRINGTPVGLRLGRQVIAFADNRLFGPGNWGNVGRYWWDAARLYLDTGPARIDVLYGKRVVSEQTRINQQHFDYDMRSLYLKMKKLPVRLDLFYVGRRDDAGDDGEPRRIHTAGVHINRHAGGRWDYGGTLALQFGTLGEDRIRAHGGNARVGHTFAGRRKPRIAAEYSFASGDGDPLDGSHETWDGVFGSCGCLYGRMNLFSWKNMRDHQITFGIRPLRRLHVWVDFHDFRLASSTDAWYWRNGKPIRQDVTGASGSEVGREVDILAKWNASRHVELFAGYGRFFPAGFIERTSAEAEPADWGFVQWLYQF